MVAASERITGKIGEPRSPECMPLVAAVALGRRHNTIYGSRLLLGAVANDELTRREYDSIMVRVGRQTVSIHVTGCTPEQESNLTEGVPVVVDCPSECAQRCAGCILGLANGEEALAELKANFVPLNIKS